MKPWLELLRISNLPTVWSNVIAGAVIASVTLIIENWLFPLVVVLIAGSSLYLAGMVLNDVFDLDIDRRERPSRPLPSGRITVGQATLLGWSLLIIGGFLPFAVSITSGIISLLLAVCVVLYEKLHARTTWSVLLMAVCRAGLYVLAAIAMISTIQHETGAAILQDRELRALLATGFIALPVLIHVACFSVIARFEVPDAEETCPSCGQIVLPEAIACPECGDPCGPAARLDHAKQRQFKKQGWWGTGTLALLVPFASCCGFAVVAGMVNRSSVMGKTDLLILFIALISVVILGSYLVTSTRWLASDPTKIGPFVLRSIAAMSLYDMLVCVIAFVPMIGMSNLYGLPPLTCGVCFVVVWWAHRRIPGT